MGCGEAIPAQRVSVDFAKRTQVSCHPLAPCRSEDGFTGEESAAASSETADSSRDHTAHRNDKPLRVFKVHHYRTAEGNSVGTSSGLSCQPA